MTNNTFLRRLVPSLAAAVLLAYSPAQAATSTGSLSISATVAAACSVSGSAIAFGAYTATQVDQTGTISVVCTSGTNYTVALDAGVGSGATTAARKMTGSAGGTMNYVLSRDSGHANNWGNNTGTDTSAGTGNGSTQNITVYGRIASGQTPPTGNYSDSVTVTLTY